MSDGSEPFFSEHMERSEEVYGACRQLLYGLKEVFTGLEPEAMSDEQVYQAVIGLFKAQKRWAVQQKPQEEPHG